MTRQAIRQAFGRCRRIRAGGAIALGLSLFPATLGIGIAAQGPSPAAGAAASCNDALRPPREVKGQKVGPASCMLQEAAITYDGRAYTRLDVGLDGSVDGYSAKVGDYKDYFSNGPDLVFPQTWGARQISSASPSTSARRAPA